VWAARRGRARTLAQTFDHLLSILSFDAPYFEEHGLAVTNVGNPHLMRPLGDADPARLRAHLSLQPDDPILLILPGSRPGEIQRLMPPFGAAAAELKQGRPRLQLVLAAAPTVADAIKVQAATWPYPPHVIEGDALKVDAMAAATVALACSGTVTTELAIAGAPMVVAYKLSPISAFLIRMVIKTRFITLFNIAAGRAVAPELIQEHCTGPELAAALAARLDDEALRLRQIEDQTAALALLGPRDGPDPSERAAEAVIALMDKSRAADVEGHSLKLGLGFRSEGESRRRRWQRSVRSLCSK
jgi:lipid-A-disaccharide synthase